MIPYPAKIDKKIPNKKIHRSAAKECMSGKINQEKDPITVIATAIFSRWLFETIKPNPAGIMRKPFTRTKRINRFFGL
jgi:hypothetical protein